MALSMGACATPHGAALGGRQHVLRGLRQIVKHPGSSTGSARRHPLRPARRPAPGATTGHARAHAPSTRRNTSWEELGTIGLLNVLWPLSFSITTAAADGEQAGGDVSPPDSYRATLQCCLPADWRRRRLKKSAPSTISMFAPAVATPRHNTPSVIAYSRRCLADSSPAACGRSSMA